MTDESILQGQIYEMMQCCASNCVTKKIGNIIDLLRITAHADELTPQDDRADNPFFAIITIHII